MDDEASLKRDRAEIEPDEPEGRSRPRGAISPLSSAAEIEAAVEASLNKLFTADVDEVAFTQLLSSLRSDEPRAAGLTSDQVEAALEAMEAANKVMHREGRIHLI